MVGDDNLDHGVTVATSRERMAAHRERRRKNLVQFTVAVAADELAKIARSGYPEVQSEDEKRAVEALSLFITDTLAARSAGTAARSINFETTLLGDYGQARTADHHQTKSAAFTSS